MPEKFEGFAPKEGGGLSVHGSIAQRLMANNFNIEALRRTNATLTYDAWKEIDKAVLQAAVRRRVGTADLFNMGLIYTVDGLSTMVLQYQNVNDMTDADVTMDARALVEKDRPNYELGYLPLPITHKDFDFNIRELGASRKAGQPLDTTSISTATRKVIEKVETFLFQGSSSFTYGDGTIYGYMTHPDREQVDFSDGEWDLSTGGAGIITDVRAMKQASIDNYFYGPWMLYIPTAYETVIDDDFKAASDKTIRQRILEIDGIMGVKVADFLTDNNVILVQMTEDVVRLVNGLDVVPVEWDEQGGMVTNYKVMTIQVPQLRSDQNNRCGIIHLS